MISNVSDAMYRMTLLSEAIQTYLIHFNTYSYFFINEPQLYPFVYKYVILGSCK